MLGSVLNGVAVRTARKELLEWRRDAWLPRALISIAVLGLLAAISGTVSSQARARVGRASQERDYQRWLAQPPRNAHSASHFGMSAYHVPSRLAPLDPGVGPYVGSSLFLEAHKQNEPIFSEAADSGSTARLGALSLATLLQVWLPLIVITTMAGAFAAEREQGTLAQLLSSGVAAWRLAAGKMLAAALVALGVALPAIAYVTFELLTTSTDPWPADTGRRLFVLIAGYGLYLGFWIMLAVAVSGLMRTWRLSAAVLATAWCAAVVVTPHVAIDVARTANPLPSRAELDRLELESRMQTPESYERRKQEILDEYGAKTVKELPIEFSVIYAQRAEQRINDRLDRRIADIDAVYRTERTGYLRAALITPAVAMDVVSAAAAGTDDVHYRAFLRQAEDYRRAMMHVLGEAEIRKPGEQAARGDAALWARLPPFRFHVPPLWASGSSAGRALAVLAGWLALSAGAAALVLRGMSGR